MKTSLIALALAALTLNGCATMNQPREATTVVIETSKPREEALTSVMRALATNGYRIRSFDKSAGILNTEPKQFAISRGLLGIKDEGALKVQVIALDKGVQLQILADCRYNRMGVGYGAYGQTTLTSSDAGYSSCVMSDQEASSVLPEEERQVQNVVRVALGQTELPPLAPKAKPKMDPNSKGTPSPFATSGS